MRIFTSKERKYMTDLFFRNLEFEKEKNKIIEERINLNKPLHLNEKMKLNTDLRKLDLIYNKKKKRGLNKPMNGAERAMRMRIRKKVRVAVHDLLVANYCSLIPSTVWDRKLVLEEQSISGLEEFMDLYLEFFQDILEKYDEKSAKEFVYGGRPKFKGLKDVKKI